MPIIGILSLNINSSHPPERPERYIQCFQAVLPRFQFTKECYCLNTNTKCLLAESGFFLFYIVHTTLFNMDKVSKARRTYNNILEGFKWKTQL